MSAVEVIRMDHVGVMVSNLDDAVAWYETHLGATVEDRWDDAGAAMAWAHLRVGGTRIEFVQREGLAPASAATTGYHHIAVVVADAHGATEALAAAGGTIMFAPSYFGRHDMDWSFVRDPFDNVIEVVSYRSSA